MIEQEPCLTIGLRKILRLGATVGFVFALLFGRAVADQSTEDLAAAAQNPVAAMYSLPF